MRSLSVVVAMFGAAASAQTPPPFAMRSIPPTPADLSDAPKTLSIKDGIYSGEDGGVTERVPADGRFHPITGDPNSDEESVLVVSDRKIKVMKRSRGRNSYLALYTLSADGGTLTLAALDMTRPEGKPVEIDATRSRVGPPVAGADPISGRWRTERVSVSVPKPTG